jgi:hypothetical protein
MSILRSMAAATTTLANLSPPRHQDTKKALENIVQEMGSGGA